MSSDLISAIEAYSIFDSRGHPTIEAVVHLVGGLVGVGRVPSGASKGEREALELRDHDDHSFGGKSVRGAISNIVQVIAPALKGKPVCEQSEIDALMIDLDGTPNKSNLGANAILAVSLAVCDAAARSKAMPLFRYLATGDPVIPLPEIQIFGGGAHSAGRVDVQDYMITCIGAKSLHDCYRMTFDIYQAAGQLLAAQNRLNGVADEGGHWPSFTSNEEGLEMLSTAIRKAGYTLGEEVAISLDIAASDFYRSGEYYFDLERRVFSPTAWTDTLSDWCQHYQICSIEDPFSENDHESWQKFTRRWQDNLQIIGDDLFTTNPTLIRHGIKDHLANSVLIKPNQIGTISETLAAIEITKQAGWYPVISARSGETEDTFIAHLSVAVAAGQLKVGSFTRSERMAKWNELIRIGRALGPAAKFATNVIDFPW